ncbi:MAG: hypothetical protein R3A10_01595 [Caldilineaceae bacterium]
MRGLGMIQGVELVTDRAADARGQGDGQSRLPCLRAGAGLLRACVQQRAGDHAAADHDPSSSR